MLIYLCLILGFVALMMNFAMAFRFHKEIESLRDDLVEMMAFMPSLDGRTCLNQKKIDELEKFLRLKYVPETTVPAHFVKAKNI